MALRGNVRNMCPSNCFNSLMSVPQTVKPQQGGTFLHITQHVMRVGCVGAVFRNELEPHRKRSTCNKAAFNIIPPRNTSLFKPTPPNIWFKQIRQTKYFQVGLRVVQYDQICTESWEPSTRSSVCSSPHAILTFAHVDGFEDSRYTVFKN